VAPSKVLAAMLIFSAVCMLIPRKWDRSDQIKQVAQPLTPLQALMTRGTSWAAQPEASSAPADPEAALNQLALEGQYLAFAEEIRNLRQRNSELSTLREGGYLPRRLGQLIQADVISHDSLAWRSVLEINLGGKAGAVKSQWATSAIYLDRGSQDGLKPQRNVFTVECLVGQIVWVGPYTSRVQLLTDPASQVPVRIARLQPNTPLGVTYAPGTFVLEGTGQGMVIQQVDYRLKDSGQVQVGDLVVLQPNANLPEEAASLRRIGRIAKITPDRSQSVWTLQVTPLLKLDSLKHVYVFDPTPVQ
jgi:cell shape-determining protein MreC